MEGMKNMVPDYGVFHIADMFYMLICSVAHFFVGLCLTSDYKGVLGGLSRFHCIYNLLCPTVKGC